MSFNAVSKVWSGFNIPGVLNPEASIGQIVLNVLQRSPSHKVVEICSDSGEEITCKQLWLRIVRVVQNLSKMGFKKGDLCGIMLRNQPNLSALVIGAMSIGVTIIGLDPVSTEENLEHILQLSKPILLFCEQSNIELTRKVCDKLNISPKLVVYGPENGNAISVNDILASTGEETRFIPPYLGDSKETIAFITCSSGTTGLAKGICLSHAQLILQNNSVANQDPGKVLYFSTIYWISSITLMLKALFNGAVRVTTMKSYTPDVALDIIEKYKIAYVYLPEWYFGEFVRHPRTKTANLSSLKLVMNGGGHLNEKLQAEMENYLSNGQVSHNYGLSEAGGTVSSTVIRRKTGSCGLLMPNIKVKIVDDEGNQLGVEEKGEICVQSTFPYLGYYNDKEATKNCFKDGWVMTGDIGYFDTENFLYVCDRKREVFKYKTSRIFPAEIENIIKQHEAVKDVCVTYIHDATLMTDLPTAVVVKHPGSEATAEDILNFSNNSLKSDDKKLRGGLYIVEEIPKTVSGKKVKNLVRVIVEREFRKRLIGSV